MGWVMGIVLLLALGTTSVIHGVARIHYEPSTIKSDDCDTKRPGSRT
jgi:hypothetical protein